MFFDSEQEEDLSFAPLPVGEYALTVVHAETAPTASGTGEMFKVEFSVDDSGKKLFDRFNLKNANPTAAKIGRSQLKELCVMAGRPALQVESDLVGARVSATVGHREYNGKLYESIQKYSKLSEASFSHAKPPQTMQTQQQGQVDVSQIPF